MLLHLCQMSVQRRLHSLTVMTFQLFSVDSGNGFFDPLLEEELPADIDDNEDHDASDDVPEPVAPLDLLKEEMPNVEVEPVELIHATHTLRTNP